VRRLIQIAVSIVSLLTIIAGATYAYDRETVHDADLPELYRQMNHDSFDGTLPYAQLWTELRHRYSQTTVYEDGTALVEIDRNVVQTRAQLMETLRHEGCHALTYQEAKARNEDDHGTTWHTCMERFK
jgi:predicted SprT family Zn-dependent metalloprotease